MDDVGQGARVTRDEWDKGSQRQGHGGGAMEKRAVEFFLVEDGKALSGVEG